MITISELRITNFLRFRGEHVIPLKPTVYGITARWDDSPDRSNWAGKSSFLEAIVFAMFGCHRCRAHDDLLTHEEQECRVVVILDVDGRAVEVNRRFGRGQPVRFVLTDVDKAYRGEEAQSFLESLIGLSKKDFMATALVAQKQMSRFITQDPAERMALVVEWLHLQALEDAKDHASQKIRAALDRQTVLEVSLATLQSKMEDASRVLGRPLVDLQPDQISTEFESAIARQTEAVGVATGNVQLLETQRDRRVAAERDSEDAKEFHRVAAEGKRLQAKLQTVDVVSISGQIDHIQDRRSELQAEFRSLEHACRQLQTWSIGKFDGTCPTFGISCPASVQINAAATEGATKLAVASAQKSDVSAKMEALASEAKKTLDVRTSIERDVASLENCKQQALRLKQAAARVMQNGESEVVSTDEDLSTARSALATESVKLKELRAAHESATQIVDKVYDTRAAIAQIRPEIELLQEAIQILGKEGAQKEFGRRMLVDVERSANASLAECGIDLSVGVSWSRNSHAGMPCKTCPSCGYAFGASDKSKECPRCKAARSPGCINKLEVVLSDRSGAAEDLAGVAIQLSAMAWLRDFRNSPWGVVFLDEPFGALDAHNRQAFAAHVATMLGSRYGVLQAFVVAHDAAIMDALPGRIEIAAGIDGSRFALVDDGTTVSDAKGAVAKPVAASVIKRRRRVRRVENSEEE
jgi:DNA repair exonuclease SbcCD ATPase subunit